MILSSSYDGLCRIWDATTGLCLKTIYLDKTPPVSFSRFSPNGKYIFASYLDSTIRLWNWHNGQCEKEFKGHRNEKHCIVSSIGAAISTQPLLVCGSEDGGVYIWDIKGKKRKLHSQKLIGHVDTVLSVACHPTQALIASGGMDKDKCVKLWRHQPNIHVNSINPSATVSTFEAAKYVNLKSDPKSISTSSQQFPSIMDMRDG
jgi:COMPASS component SWD3